MFKAKVSSVRRLGGADDPLRDPAEIPSVLGPASGAQDAARLKWLMPGAPLDSRQHPSSRPQAAELSGNKRPAAAAPPLAAGRNRVSSKSQALAAFHSAVEGASRARVGLQEQHQEGTAGAPNTTLVDGPGSKDLQTNAAQPPTTAAAGGLHSQPHAQPLAATSRPPRAAAGAAAAAPAGTQSQLLQRTVKALQHLQQQLQSRTHTYLYQIDGLLQAAHDAVAALNARLAASTAAAGEPVPALLQLCAADGGLDEAAGGGLDTNAAAADAGKALQGICCSIWVSDWAAPCTRQARVAGHGTHCCVSCCYLQLSTHKRIGEAGPPVDVNAYV